MKKIVFLVITLLLCNHFMVSAQQKVALVVGNNNYKEEPLKNAVNDAHLMETTLQKLGFTVQKVLNASKADFERQLLTFNRNYKSAAIRFFYYAGHGIQLDGVNYLVPVDAVLEDKEDAKIECVNFSTIFSTFQNSNPDAMNIFVMDACRNNPFRSRSWGSRGSDDRGLVLRKGDFASGSYAAFSADNGQQASDGSNSNNGLYTKVLCEEMLQPGVEISLLFQRVRGKVIKLSDRKQTPVEENRLINEEAFYFIPPSNKPAPDKPTPDKPTPVNTDGVVINGVRWATKNVGAFAPEDYGNYYTWEEAKTACPKGWRLPTKVEFESLINAGNVWTTQNGKNGCKFGEPNNFVFFPAAGYRLSSDGTLYNVGSYGYYWSGTPNGAENAYLVYFYSGYAYTSHYYIRSYGFSVRCVSE